MSPYRRAVLAALASATTLAAAGAVLAVAAPPALAATTTKTWRVTTWKDLEEGEADGVLLSSAGEVATGLGSTRVDLAAAQVFSSATTPDGAVWLGTGDQAEVHRWDGKTATKVTKLDGVLVSALCAAPDNAVYAATLPGGRIHRVQGAGDGGHREIARLEGADQIWALALDAAGAHLYAATGPGGKLFDVEIATGKSRVLWESGEKHLLSMVRDGDSLIVGTAEEAILYRVSTKDGTARALHDFAADEIRAIVRADSGALYLAVNETERSRNATSTTATPVTGSRAVGTRIGAPTAAVVAGAVPAGRDRKGKGAVFRLDVDGRVEQLHALADGYFTALALDPADRVGSVFAAAGSNGRVYKVQSGRDKPGEAQPDPASLSRVVVLTTFTLPERQVLTLALGGRNPVLGTGDAGALYALDLNAGKQARYVSKVLDAGAAARFGAIRWLGDGPVTLETRSGNTARPDKTWADWQPLKKSSASRDSGGPAIGQDGKIQSPGARFLQYRATLGKAARLRDVAVYYAPQNQRSRVTEITVGEDPSGRVARPARTAGRPRSAVIKLRWKTDTGDDDDLAFRVQYREEAEGATWKPVGGPELPGAPPLTAREYEWNTDGLADGVYRLRVVASDERVNPRDVALAHELVTPPFTVDNRRPDIESLRESGGEVTALARDAATPIAELSYSIDGGEWLALSPKDGVFDDLAEEVALKLPDSLSPGPHTVALRAVDGADNVGVSQIQVRAKAR